jgi:hypothetical protein
MRMILRLLLITTLMLALFSLQGAAQSRPRSCTHGASSIRAELVNGRVEVSQPVVTGCVP